MAGSYHVGEGADARNESVGLVPGDHQRMLHRKVVPFSDEFGIDGPWKEGIEVGPQPELTIYHSDRFRFCLLTCKDFLNDDVLHALSRVAANVVCVAAMSEKTTAFKGRAEQQVLNAQAVTVMSNGPLQWQPGVVEPAAVFGQPVPDRMSVRATLLRAIDHQDKDTADALISGIAEDKSVVRVEKDVPGADRRATWYAAPQAVRAAV